MPREKSRPITTKSTSSRKAKAAVIIPSISSECPISRLSDELVVAILEEIDNQDSHSLQNICIAFHSDPRLYHLAKIRRWKHVTIDDQDLVPAPGHDLMNANRIRKRMRARKVTRDWKPRGYNTHLLITASRDGSSCCPANYIQDLDIDLNMSRWRTKAILDKNFRKPREIVPSLASFVHTLGLIHPHLINIRSVECNGEVPQAIIDMIGKLVNRRRVHNLVLHRHYSEKGRLWDDYEWLDAGLSASERFSNDLSVLNTLSELKTLQMHRITQREVHSLFRTLPQFYRLNELVIADEFYDGPRDACGMRKLFELLLGYRRETVPSRTPARSSQAPCLPCFPRSLRVLKLVENHPFSSAPYIWPNRTQTPTTSDQILNLCLDTGTLHRVSHLLPHFEPSKLKLLSIPTADGYCEGDDFDDLDFAISPYMSSLKRINLLNAGLVKPTFAEDFNRRWDGKFSIQELVLGTQALPGTWNRDPPVDKHSTQTSQVLAQYLNACDRRPTEPINHPAKWGDRLRRIRIDPIALENLDTSILQESRFDQLRILMLQPFDRSFVLHVNSRWSPSSLTEYEARRLAENISSNSSTTLRVFVVQRYWYWIPHSDARTRGISVMSWTEAHDCPSEAAEMKRSLTKADWSFLESDTPPFWNRSLTSTHDSDAPSSISRYHHSDFLTALPIDD